MHGSGVTRPRAVVIPTEMLGLLKHQDLGDLMQPERNPQNFDAAIREAEVPASFSQSART